MTIKYKKYNNITKDINKKNKIKKERESKQ